MQHTPSQNLASISASDDAATVQFLVENAVFRDDVALLRLVFTTGARAAAQASAEAGFGESQDARMGATSHPAPRVMEVLPAKGPPVMDVIQQSLKAIAAEQDEVIKDICMSNAMDIAGCISEMGDMQAGVEELRALLQEGNEALQGTGQALVESARALSELVSVQANVLDGLAAVKGARQLLGLCLQVGELLEERKLYRAWQLIEEIRKEHLGPLLENLASQSSSMPPSGTDRVTSLPSLPSQQQQQQSRGGMGAGPSQLSRLATMRRAGGMTGGGAGAGGGAGGLGDGAPAGGGVPAERRAANAVALRALFESLVRELTAALESLAVTEFNAWLLDARSSARTVGLRAVRKAAIERQLGEDLAVERQLMMAGAAQRQTGSQPASAPKSLSEQATSLLMRSPFRQDILKDCAPSAFNSASSHQVQLGRQPQQQQEQHAVTGADIISAASGLPRSTLLSMHPGVPHRAAAHLLNAWHEQRAREVHTAMREATSGANAPGTLLGLGQALSRPSDSTTSLLAGIDMRPLYSAVHIHQVLNRDARLREYYQEQRRLQVAADLAPPHAPFLESYQPYLAQLVGFFVIEATVQRLVPSVASPANMGFLWEGAASQLKVVLEQALCAPKGLLSGHHGAKHGGKGDALQLGPGTSAALPPLGPSRSAASVTSGTSQGPGAPARSSASVPLPRPPQPSGPDSASSSLAPIMVLVKNFVLLVCDALEDLGLGAGPLEEVLASAGIPYHELLTAGSAKSVAAALGSDSLVAGVEVWSESIAKQLCSTLGLPSQLDTAGATKPVTVPFTAPFTSLVPALLRVVRGYVADSAAYLRGLVAPWDMAAALSGQRDRLVQSVVVEALLGRLSAVVAGARVPEAMRMVANAWALSQAAPALDVYTLDQAAPLAEQHPRVKAAREASSGGMVGALGAPQQRLTTRTSLDAARARADTGRGTGRRNLQLPALLLGGSGPGGGAAATLAASLRLVQESCERALLRIVSSRVEGQLSAGIQAADWVPAAPLPPGTSPYMEHVLAFLQETFEAATRALPRASYLFLVRTVFKSIALSFLRLFSPDGLKGYNLLAIERLAQDVAACQSFASRCHLPVPAALSSAGAQALSLSGGGPSPAEQQEAAAAAAAAQGASFAQEFAEAAQLCKLLMSETLEEVLVPELRRQRYPNLEAPTIVLALDKYRELLKVGKQRTSFPTKKTVDGIAKALRGQMVAGTAAIVLQGVW